MTEDAPSAADHQKVGGRTTTQVQFVVVSVAVCLVGALMVGGCRRSGEHSNRAAAFAPAWSPDGQRILFSVDPEPSEGCGYGSCRFRIEVWMMASTGEGARRLVLGLRPAWSPDGRRVAFQGGSWNFGIYTMRVDGTGIRRVSEEDPEHEFTDPMWSPDGTAIAFVGWPVVGSTTKLYVINANGTGQRRVGRVTPFEVSWSSAGVLAFAAYEGLFTSDIEGRRVTQLFPSKGTAPNLLVSASLAWSPDGTRIAFGVEKGDGRRSFAVVDSRGRTLARPFGRPASNEDDPSWSPDGSKIAFARDDEAAPGIYVVDDHGRHLKRLSTSGSDPAWSPDGARIAYAADGDIYVMNADGRAKRRLYPAARTDSRRSRTALSD